MTRVPPPTTPAVAGMTDDAAISALVLRLARPLPEGGDVIARAAILAEGGDFNAVMAWITAHGGEPRTPPVSARSASGLHGSRLTATAAPAPRYVFPPGALAAVRQSDQP